MKTVILRAVHQNAPSLHTRHRQRGCGRSPPSPLSTAKHDPGVQDGESDINESWFGATPSPCLIGRVYNYFLGLSTITMSPYESNHRPKLDRDDVTFG